MIKDFVPRTYQEQIFNTSTLKNTLVVLPTGTGKTNILLMLAAHRLMIYPGSKVLVLAPTKPLLTQHFDTFGRHLDVDPEKMVILSGLVAPEKREQIWQSATVIFSTPQGMQNDILTERIKLEDFSLICFDEAHRATGNYAYNYIAEMYYKKGNHARILALTASPGVDTEKIKEVCKNLYIEEIESRTEDDPDVKQYLQELEISYIKVGLPESLKEVQKALQECVKGKLLAIKNMGYLNSTDVSKRALLELQSHLHTELATGPDYNVMRAISIAAEAIKVEHALELLETQGLGPLNIYFRKLQSDALTAKTKAVQNLVRDELFKKAAYLAMNMQESSVEHPKLQALKDLVQKELEGGAKRIIIFNQYRDMIAKINDDLASLGIDSRVFVGQANKNEAGMSQKKQKDILDEFRQGSFRVLVSSSVAEEGLDVPGVDTVIFYEPIPSAIRTIQRKGRTARHSKGRVYVLVTQDTRDMSYRWAAYHKEKKMHRVLSTIKKDLQLESPTIPLQQYVPERSEMIVYVDSREQNKSISKILVDMGIKVRLIQLDIGDYIVSDRCAIEYKSVPDFVDSLLDGRLLEQVKNLKDRYYRPVIIIEGKENIYDIRKVHPNAIRGLLATIAVSYGVPILTTRDTQDTASLIASIAKREQDSIGHDFSPHSKKPQGIREQQEYIVSSFPGVGMSLARRILSEFGSIRKIVNADEGSLKKIDKIGDTKAAEIRKILDMDYNS